jgi:glycosyltransferase involved in cell wall biosynthesis
VLVVDSGSTDKTLEVCESLGAKTMYNEWSGYGPQKVFAEKTCKHDWVFNIDADEEIMPALRDEIIALFSKGEPEAKAFNIKRKMLFDYQQKPPPFAPSDFFVRLYDRRCAGFSDSPVHDKVHLHKGKEVTLKNYMLHRCFRSYSHWADKINYYSSMQAEDRLKKGKNVSALRVLVDPPLSFFKAYIMRRYFVYGVEGFIHSMVYVYARLMRLAKTREKFREQS